MKSLIIHPKDSSTAFLELIYEPIPDKTIVTGGITKAMLSELIKSHDRIIMLGHGSHNGLYAMGLFPGSGMYVIDKEMAPLLKTKAENVFIWCNADWFVKTHDLNGFYSGMFVSEVEEAEYVGLTCTDQSLVDESNYGFSRIAAKYINESSKVLCTNVKKEYGLMALKNPVAQYNNNRLYCSLHSAVKVTA